MAITASQLRADVYRLLDQALETGQPIEIERHGALLRIVPPRPAGRFDRLPRREITVGDPEALVDIDWTDAWNPDLP